MHQEKSSKWHQLDVIKQEYGNKWMINWYWHSYICDDTSWYWLCLNKTNHYTGINHHVNISTSNINDYISAWQEIGEESFNFIAWIPPTTIPTKGPPTSYPVPQKEPRKYPISLPSNTPSNKYPCSRLLYQLISYHPFQSYHDHCILDKVQQVIQVSLKVKINIFIWSPIRGAFW